MRALPVVTLAALAICVSGTDLVHRKSAVPLRKLIAPSPNPRMGFSFVEAQLARHVLHKLLAQRYPRVVPSQLRQLVGPARVAQLATLLRGKYRTFIEPIYSSILPYYLYNRGGARLFSRRNLYTPLPRLTAGQVQLQFLRFLTRIDPRLLVTVGPKQVSYVQSQLLAINKGYRLPQQLLHSLYNSFISVIGGNGRSGFLLNLKPQARLEHFSNSLGLYLRHQPGGLAVHLKNRPLFIQGYCNLVDSAYILRGSGIGIVRHRHVPDAADVFFHQLEAEHLSAVSNVITDILRVQQSIDLATLPHLGGYGSLLTSRFYPGFHAGQTDIIARYILRGLVGSGAITGGGLVSTLPYLPYVRGLPAGIISTIQGSNLRSLLAGLKIRRLTPRLTPGILSAARSGRLITQALLAAILHGVRFNTAQQATLIYRDILASLLLHEKKFHAARFSSFLSDPLRPFVLLNRLIVPNTLPALRLIPAVRLVPLNTIISIRVAIQQGLVRVPQQLVAVQQKVVPHVVGPPLVVEPRQMVGPPLVVVPTLPPFPSVVVSRITLTSSVSRRVYTILRGGISVLTVELLQPVLQLLVDQRVIPVQVLTTPIKLTALLSGTVIPRFSSNIAQAIQLAAVPSFVKDKTFTIANARVAYALECLVIYSHGYNTLPASIVTSTLGSTLQSYYSAHSVFQAPGFLSFGIKYYPQLIGSGLLARPLPFGSHTLTPSVVTSTLAGLRPVYGPLTYHGLGTVLRFPGTVSLLRGVSLTDPAALVKALTLGGHRPVFSLSTADIAAVNGLLQPVSSSLFDSSFAISDLRFLFSFAVRDLRIPRSIYGKHIGPLFRTSLVQYLKLGQPLITNHIYNPAYLKLAVNDVLVKALTAGSLSPQVQLRIPSGLVTLAPHQYSTFYQRTLLPLRLRLAPQFTGQLLSYAFTMVPTLRTIKPSLAVSSFSRYLGTAPFSKFRFNLRKPEFTSLISLLSKRHRLPSFFLGYPQSLQRYYFDNLFGSYAAYSLLHSSQFIRPLSHRGIFRSFQQRLIPRFFKGHKFSNLGDLWGAAPAYFRLCQQSYKTMPGLRVLQARRLVGRSSRLVHVAGGRKLGYGYLKGVGGRFSRNKQFFD